MLPWRIIPPPQKGFLRRHMVVFVTSVHSTSPTCALAQVTSVEMTRCHLMPNTFPMWIMLLVFSEPLLGHLLFLVFLRRGRSSLHVQGDGIALGWISIECDGILSFSSLLLPKLATFCIFFRHVGNVLVILNEMQTAEFWQLSGGGILCVWTSVWEMAFPLYQAEVHVERVSFACKCPSCFPCDTSAEGSTGHCNDDFKASAEYE